MSTDDEDVEGTGEATSCHESIIKKIKRKITVATIINIVAVVILAYLAGLFISSTLPYRPYAFHNFVVRPNTVCADSKVTAHVTRKFTKSFNQFSLQESWVAVQGVRGVSPGEQVRSFVGSLPEDALHPTDTQTVQSPILTTAPSRSGVYRVSIEASAAGIRFGIFPASSTSHFTSGTVTVLPTHSPQCKDGDHDQKHR